MHRQMGLYQKLSVVNTPYLLQSADLLGFICILHKKYVPAIRKFKFHFEILFYFNQHTI